MSESQNAAGRRIDSLLDANSFVEIGGLVTARATDFNLSAKETPSDGVITGYGTIGGSLVYIYSQDVKVLGGTIGEMHAKKIARVYELAEKTGAPVIGLIDCGGVRLEESTDALDALGSIMKNEAAASGVIPQITAVYGNCGGFCFGFGGRGFVLGELCLVLGKLCFIVILQGNFPLSHKNRAAAIESSSPWISAQNCYTKEIPYGLCTVLP